MRTYHYKTLRGLLRANGLRYLTLSDYLSKRIYSEKHGWMQFELSDDADLQFVSGIAGVLWVRPNDEQLRRVAYAHPMGILRRLWYNGRRFEYCAGQDYDAEIRYIRRTI